MAKDESLIEKRLPIVVVEDTKALNILITSLLKEEGYKVEQAFTGKEALDIISNSDTNKLLVLDYMLPDMTADSLLRSIKGTIKDFPVIIMTGYSDERVAVELMKLGARDYLSKDDNFNENIVSVIANTLNNFEKELEITKKEKALQLAEQQWQMTFDGISDPLWIMTPDFIITQCNRTLGEFLNLPVKDIIGRKCYELLHNTNKPVNSCPCELMSRSKIKSTANIKLNGKWLESTVYPLFDEYENLKSIIHIAIDRTEKIKTEEKLRISEDNYRNLVENISDVICSLDPQGRITYISPNVEQLLGYCPTELIKNPFIEVIHSDDKKRFVEGFNGLLTGNKTRWEYRISKKSGDLIWIRISSNPVKKNNDKVFEIHTIITDITERKRAEQALQKAHDRAQRYLDIAGVMFIALDNKGEVILVNKKASEILGYTEEEIVGTNWFDNYLPKKYCTEVKSVFHQLMKGEIEPVEYYENPVLTKSEQEKIIAWHNAVVKSPEGEIIGTISSGEDITGRKEAEEQIAKSKQNLQRAQELAHIGSWVWNTETNEIEMSAELYNILGLVKGEGPPPFDSEAKMVHPDDRALIHDSVTRCIEERMPYSLDYRIYRHNDGEMRHLHVETEVEVLQNKDQLTIYGTVQDITELKNAEEEKQQLQEQLHQAQKMEAIGQLAGGIAHDFNNILGGITGYADVIGLKIKQDTNCLPYIDKIRDSALKASDVVRQLLTYARKAITEFKPFDVHKSIEQVNSVLKHTIDKTIERIIIMDSEKSTIVGDPNQVESALLNIALNARDAMHEGGKLTIQTENVKIAEGDIIPDLPVAMRPGDYIKILISDTGTGIDKKVRDKIFEPFFTTKRLGEGTGLGLAVTYGTLKQHKGYITVSSEKNKGSDFNLYFPLITESSISMALMEDDEFVEGTGNILVIDDEEPICEAITEILSDLGYTVYSCTNGVEAIEYYRENYDNVDAVILDLVMPKMGGFTCFRELKKVNPDIKVIIASGYSEGNEGTNIIKEGAKILIEKPFEMEKLSQVLAEVLKQ